MSIFASFITFLENFATQVPLEIFSFLGAIIEEIIAPIPSPLVMTLSGSIAQAQGRAMWYLLIVALIGAFGKTIGSLLFYFVADKGEDVLIDKFGKYIGLSHKDLEGIGQYFQGGWRDDAILFVLRAIPVLPSAPVSVVAGVIKLNMRTYITSTFFGNVVRNLMFLYLGYAGLHSSEELMNGLDSLESLFKLIFVGVIGLFIVWIYFQRSKGARLPWATKKKVVKSEE